MKVDTTTTTAITTTQPPTLPPASSSPQHAIPITTTTTAPSSALIDIGSGSLAGLLGKIVEFPFDTVKVRLQSQPDHLPLQYSGPVDCFRQSWRADGLGGLYRGVSAPLAGAAAETACLFWSYRVAQDVLARVAGGSGEQGLGLGALVAAGGMSGGVTSLILTPIELVKCRMQVPLHSPLDPSLGPRPGLRASQPLSPLAVVADVYRREGLRGFWRGQLGTFLRETGGTAAWFGSYEASGLFFRKRLREEAATADSAGEAPLPLPLPLPQQLASGALAGMSYNFLFYPADTIKSKIQTGELTHARPTFLSVGRALWRSHGLRGLYRGCGITVARSAPSSALIFTVVEELKRAFA